MTDGSMNKDTVVSMTASDEPIEDKRSPSAIFGEMRHSPEQIEELFRSDDTRIRPRFAKQRTKRTKKSCRLSS